MNVPHVQISDVDGTMPYMHAMHSLSSRGHAVEWSFDCPILFQNKMRRLSERLEKFALQPSDAFSSETKRLI